jgi:hypothetical protein
MSSVGDSTIHESLIGSILIGSILIGSILIGLSGLLRGGSSADVLIKRHFISNQTYP